MNRPFITERIVKNNAFYLFLSLYAIIISFMVQRSIDNGEFDFRSIVQESLLPIFFILLLSFLIEILNFKNITKSIGAVLSKSILFSLIPLLVSLIVVVKLENGVFNDFHILLLGIVSISFYWFLLTTTTIVWLGWKAIFILVLFLFAPAISEFLEGIPFKEYLPFEIIITIFKGLRSNKLNLMEFGVLGVYAVILLFILQRKKA